MLKRVQHDGVGRVLAAALLLAAPAAHAAPPPGMSRAEFQALRVQNTQERANGQSASCPPVRKIMCRAMPVAEKKPGAFGPDAQYACTFEERARGKWRPRRGVMLARFGEQWDFNNTGLAACKLL